MYGEAGTVLVQILEIVWINLLLSGDNAVVIALACRSLAPQQRRIGILLGTCAAVALRLLFTLIVVALLTVPFLKLIGGAALFWIAVKLLDEKTDGDHVAEASTVWRAVRSIAIADAVMSLDNMIAVAAAANGSTWLIVFGLVLSVPLIMFSAGLVTIIIERFPALVWAGAALLGWIAARLAISDSALAQFSGAAEHLDLTAGAIGAVLVVAIGAALRRLRAAGNR
jgi:YjbE family integral membrane protein